MIRILIADDHTLFRQSLTEMLDKESGIKVVGYAADGESCVETCRRLNPDIILMDIDMPGITGIEATGRILRDGVSTRSPHIIMLSMYSDRAHVFDSVRAGAMGYAVKDCTPSELLKIIKSVSSGCFMLHPSLAGSFISSVRTLPYEINCNLTARETELISCVSRGLSNKQIASKLFLSERTVKNHLNLIFRKLGAANRAQAVNKAIKSGIIATG